MSENCHRKYKRNSRLNRHINLRYPKDEAVTFGKCNVVDLDSILHLLKEVQVLKSYNIIIIKTSDPDIFFII